MLRKNIAKLNQGGEGSFEKGTSVSWLNKNFEFKKVWKEIFFGNFEGPFLKRSAPRNP